LVGGASVSTRAWVLLGHSSRDVQWAAPLERLAQQLRELKHTPNRVACAYLEHTPPTLASVAHQLAQAGAQHITVLPLFFGMGKHARGDLPELIQRTRIAHPHITIACKDSLGEHPLLAQWVAQAFDTP
jgi:sirohydrochlorin cobaltochelatase